MTVHEAFLIQKVEGKDKHIADLEKENAELKQAKEGKVVERFEAYGQCRDSRRIAELEAQIEKMKCCYNCANDTLEPPEVIGNGICEHCKNHDKWALAN